MIIFSVNRRTPATYYILTLSIDSLLTLSRHPVCSVAAATEKLSKLLLFAWNRITQLKRVSQYVVDKAITQYISDRAIEGESERKQLHTYFDICILGACCD